MNKALIILPTYNEKENIEKLIREILAQNLNLDILVVDDNSPDKTGQVVEALKIKLPQLFILHREEKQGLGKAYIAGFKWALARSYDYILEMDADFSHQPKYLPDLLKAVQDNDLVLGSRYIKGGGVKGWSFSRQIISRLGCFYARLILGLPFKDLTGGFKCFRRQVLESIDFDSINSNGYMFQIEMTYRAYGKNFKIKELPIIFLEREHGKSKFNKQIFLEAAINCWKLRFDF